MLTAAKGYRLKRSKLYRYASDAVDHGRQYAYRDRRRKKRLFRYLWQIRINAAARAAGLTYSRFMEGLKAAKCALDRKVIADLAATDAAAFSGAGQRCQGRAEGQARRRAGEGLNNFKFEIQPRAASNGPPVLLSNKNDQRPTSNDARPHIGCWRFDVGCWMFPPAIFLCVFCALLRLTFPEHYGRIP